MIIKNIKINRYKFIKKYINLFASIKLLKRVSDLEENFKDFFWKKWKTWM